MKKQFAVFSLMGLLLTTAAFVFSVLPTSRERKTDMRIIVAGTEFLVEVANTAYTRMQGLSGREALAEGRGMLFLFETPQVPGFWMKDMKFSIDIVWIRDGRVVGVEANVLPDDSPSRTIYYPPSPVDSVLEIPAGSAARAGITRGSMIQ